MEYINKNIRALEKFRPEFLDKLKKVNIDEKIYARISKEKAKNGTEIVSVNHNGQKVNLNSLYNPDFEATTWCSQYKFDNLCVHVFVFGMGNGTIVQEICKRLLKDGYIYIYEPNVEMFLFVLNNFDISSIISNSHVTFFVKGINDDSFYWTLRANVNWTELSSQIVCCHPKYDSIFAKEYIDYLKIIRDSNELTIVNYNTEKYFSDIIFRNTLSNIRYLENAILLSDIKNSDICDDTSIAIVVAAGPSLDKNIALLKKAEKKAFIVATDRAVPSLVKHGIDFDCMVTIDPEKPVNLFDNPRCKEIPLFCAIDSNWKILEQQKGKIIFAFYNDFLSKLYEKEGKEICKFNPGGSVATAAFSICVQLNFDRIVLVGQDLAYSGNCSHVGNETEIEDNNMGHFMVKGINGEMIKTRQDWMLFLKWYEKQIAALDSIEVIDATEGGAYIEGTEIMSLEKVISLFCQQEMDFKKKINAIDNALKGDEKNKLKKKIQGMQSELELIKKGASEAEGLCVELEKCNEHKRKTKIVHKIGKLGDEIESQLVYSLLEPLITNKTADVIAKINIMGEKKEENDKITYQRARAFYKVLAELADEIISEGVLCEKI